MRPITRSLVLPLLLLIPPTPAGAQPARAVGALEWEFFTNREFRGPVIRAAIDETRGSVFLATRATLYEVREGKPRVYAERPSDDAKLILAPGGKVFAWLQTLPGTLELFTVELRFVDNPDRRVTLKPAKGPAPGFLSLILGFQGRLIVTVTPHQQAMVQQPPLRYSFWNTDGNLVKEIDLDDVSDPMVDPSGRSLLLLGRESAVAFSNSGERLWDQRGRYRKGAISFGGTTALLNSAEAINDVVLVVNREPRHLRFATPVHHLVLPLEGAVGFIAGDRGRYAFVDLKTAKLQEGRVPLQQFSYIFSTEFLDPTAIVAGVLHPADESLKHGWPRGSIVAFDLRGNVKFLRTFDVSQATAGVPGVDALFGKRRFVGYTHERALAARTAE